MLKATVTVDLPSAEVRESRGLLGWLLGSSQGSGKEALTVSKLRLVEQLIYGFREAGVDDVISLMFDDDVAYLDCEGRDKDLEELHDAARGEAGKSKNFDLMFLTLEHQSAGLRTLIDARVQREVALGEEELSIILSSRLLALAPRGDEHAQAYGERLRRQAFDEGALDAAREALDALASRLAEALQQTFERSAMAQPSIVELIEPAPAQLRLMPALKFGDKAQTPTYRPKPSKRIQGNFADPFYYFVYDPYLALRHALLLKAFEEGAHVATPLHVLDARGRLLFRGKETRPELRQHLVLLSLIDFDAKGAVKLSDDPEAFMTQQRSSTAVKKLHL